MILTHKITLRLDSREEQHFIDAVQGDSCRSVEISLLEQGQPWVVPERTSAVVRYRRVPGGTGGGYDTLPDGNAAYSIEENKLTIHLAPQVLSVPGTAELQVTLLCEGAELTCFSIFIRVQGNLGDASEENEGYVNLTEHIRTEVEKTVTELGLTNQGNGIHYIVGDSSSVFGKWVGYCEEIQSYYDGLTIAYKTIATGGSAITTLNINNLGEVMVKHNATTDVNYYYPSDTVFVLTYTTTKGIGYWQFADLNIDTDTKYSTATGNKENTKMYLVASPNRSEIGVKTFTNVNCYIGEDNYLYSNGQKVVTMDSIPDEVPDYVRAEAERVAALVQSRQNANTVTMLLGSDIHARLGLTEGSYRTDRMLESAKHAAQAMKIIRDRVHIDFAGLLGDYIWDGGETVEEAMELYRMIAEYFDPAFNGLPQFWVKGNHDMLGNTASGVELTDDQIFSCIGIRNTGAVFLSGNRVHGHCYRDFEEFKLRVVCVNTCETRNVHSVGAAQNAWLTDVLSLSGKTGWKSIILCHVPLDSWGAESTVLKNVAAFSDSILCVIHGHLHNYLTGTLTGTSIPRICIPNIDFYRTNEYGENGTGEGAGGYIEYGEEVSYEKTAGTAEDTAFCVVTIDLKTGKLYADHYGAGYDRIIDLDTGNVEDGEEGGEDVGGDTGNYTNQIPLSTVAIDSAEIYNGVGYQAGKRINSSFQEVTASGMCCTGFIPVRVGDVVRIKNVTISGSSTAYACVYTAAGTGAVSFDGSQLTAATVNGVTTLTVTGDSVGQLYLRVSVGVIDETSIITVNEEIV